MEKRIVMTSANLQMLFAKEYEDFFAKNNLIVSCPHVINRGNITYLEGIKVRIAQKMPTKTYVGINIRKDDIINLTTVTRFVNAEQTFGTQNMEHLCEKEFLKKMKEEIKEKLLEYGFNQGIDIAVLSENEKDTGIATFSILTLAISLAMQVVTGKTTIQEIADYDMFIESGKLKDLCMTTKNILQHISPIAKEHIHTTIFFTAGINNGNICVGLEGDYFKSTYPKVINIDNNICFNHLTNPEKIAEFSVINFGGFFNEFYNTETYLHEEEEYNSILKRYKLYERKVTPHIDMTNILYLNVFNGIKELLANTNDEHLINKLYCQANRLGSHQVFIEKHMDLYRDIVAAFKKNMVFEDEKFGLIPISSGKPGGTFLCLTKPEKSRKTIEKTMDDIHKMGHITANFQYLSWEDGTSEEHLNIEQYIDQALFSPHIKENDVILECGCSSKNCCGKKIIGNHRELIEKEKESIIFDCIDGKIYLNNEVTNHNEILTQSGTVEIIRVLFENMGEYVNNSKLPVSSYSKNKNEMMGKIIGPLQELIQKKYGEKMDLQCTGSVFNFDLKLTPNMINVFLLKKIH